MEYLSITIDGMDQSKTKLPYLVRERKSGCNLWRLRFSLHELNPNFFFPTFVSTICRTHVTPMDTDSTDVYIDAHTWPHDANLIKKIPLSTFLLLK